MNRVKSTVALVILSLCSCLKPWAMEVDPPSPALEAIKSLNVPRYMGTWYEIAKFPNSFQKKCVGQTVARYSLMEDGTVKVVNRCQLENGELNEAIGVARQVGHTTSAMLKVRFAPAWLSFIPAVWGDYWVIDLDQDYLLAAVSEPKREFLWILSRIPVPDQQSYASLLERLTRNGFDVKKLELTPQRH